MKECKGGKEVEMNVATFLSFASKKMEKKRMWVCAVKGHIWDRSQLFLEARIRRQ